MITFEQLTAKLDAQFPEQLNSYTEYKCNFIKVKDASVYKEVMKALKEEFSFMYMVDVVATHWPKKRNKFEITTNLSLSRINLGSLLRLQTKTISSRPSQIYGQVPI